jgi:hypothetical protein
MPILATLDNLLGLDGLVILALGLIIFRRRLPVGARDVVRIFDPRENPMPVVGLILIVSVLLALALARRFQP